MPPIITPIAKAVTLCSRVLYGFDKTKPTGSNIIPRFKKAEDKPGIKKILCEFKIDIKCVFD